MVKIHSFFSFFFLYIAFASKPWILSQFLRLAGNETIIRSQDYFTTLRYIASNPVGE